MFSDELLEKVFSNKKVQKVPIGCQATMIKAIEQAMEEIEVEKNATVSKSELL